VNSVAAFMTAGNGIDDKCGSSDGITCGKYTGSAGGIAVGA